MLQKVYRAFGYIITKTEFNVGDTMTEDIGFCVANRFKVDKDTNFSLTKEEVNEKEYNHIWIITKGRVDCVVEETGYTYSRGAGFCTLIDGNPFGTIQGNIVQDLHLFCIAPHLNINRIPVVPRVKFFKLLEGESILMESSKLFLASGSLKIFDNVIDTTCQITVGESREVKSIIDCYGLIFE